MWAVLRVSKTAKIKKKGMFFKAYKYEIRVCFLPTISTGLGPGGTDLERWYGVCGPEDPLFTPLLQFARVPF